MNSFTMAHLSKYLFFHLGVQRRILATTWGHGRNVGMILVTDYWQGIGFVPGSGLAGIAPRATVVTFFRTNENNSKQYALP